MMVRFMNSEIRYFVKLTRKEKLDNIKRQTRYYIPIP